MSDFYKHHYVRATVPESHLADKINEFFEEGYVVNDPMPLEPQPVDHYREEIAEEDLLETIRKLYKAGWLGIEYEAAKDDECLAKTFMVTADKLAEQRWTVVGVKKVRR